MGGAAAAFVDAWGPEDAWYRGNVIGTKRALEAARPAVRRFLHMGTEAAIVWGQSLVGVDESYPLAPSSPYPYCATKAQAEQLVRDANAPPFETIVLRPRFIWGPGDTTILPSVLEMAKRGAYVWVDGGRARTSTVHIDNLVHAIELALTKGNYAAGAVAEGLWRRLGLRGEPPLTRHAAMLMSRDCVLDGSRARRDLGYAPVVSVEEGLRRMREAQARAAAGRSPTPAS